MILISYLFEFQVLLCFLDPSPPQSFVRSPCWAVGPEGGETNMMILAALLWVCGAGSICLGIPVIETLVLQGATIVLVSGIQKGNLRRHK